MESVNQLFIQLISGKVASGWSSWWSENEQFLVEKLSRTDYLKIKINKCAGAQSYLKRQGIVMELSRRAEIIDAEAGFNMAVKDQAGNLDRAALDKWYEGGISSFNDGHLEISASIMCEKIEKILNQGNASAFDDLVFDLAQLIVIGEEAFALYYLQKIIELTNNNIPEGFEDLLNYSIQFAKELIDKNMEQR